jgi:hypothetical protein
LLHHCTDHAARDDISAMMLHCNPRFTGFYVKFGFRSSHTEYASIALDPAIAATARVRVQQVDVADYAEAIATLSNTFNAQFVGPVVRTPEYVRKWLKAELGMVTAAFDESGTLVAHAAVKRKGDSTFLADFSAAEHARDDEAMHELFQSLTCSAVGALQLCRQTTNAGNVIEGTCTCELCHTSECVAGSVLVPLPLARKFQETVVGFVDEGWMYRCAAGFAFVFSPICVSCRLEGPSLTAETQTLLHPEDRNDRVTWMADAL